MSADGAANARTRKDTHTHTRGGGGCVVLCGGVALHVDSINPILFFFAAFFTLPFTAWLWGVFGETSIYAAVSFSHVKIEHMFITSYEKWNSRANQKKRV